MKKLLAVIDAELNEIDLLEAVGFLVMISLIFMGFLHFITRV